MNNQAMSFQRNYIDLNTIYPNKELDSETYKINYKNLSENEVRMEKIRNFRDSWLTVELKPNFDYVRLIKKGEGIMMSDTPMERNTNYAFLTRANGDVLICGLGLGLIVFPLLNDKNIKSITVLELDKGLIEIVKPFIKEKDVHNKVNIIHADCFEYSFPKIKKFDTIYFDIWISICGDNYKEMKLLTQKYKYNVNRDNPNKFVDSWCKSICKKQHLESERDRKFYEILRGSKLNNTFNDKQIKL